LYEKDEGEKKEMSRKRWKMRKRHTGNYENEEQK
jgi:hypothetical protein